MIQTIRHKGSGMVLSAVLQVFTRLIAVQGARDMKRGYCPWPADPAETEKLVRDVCAALSHQEAGL